MKDIFDQVRRLGLPTGEYAVIGSGVLSAHGIRAHNDIDLVVTESLYEELKLRGWKVKQVRPDFEVVTLGLCEASPGMITLQNYKPDIQKIIDTADIIEGVAFCRLSDVLYFKQALGREKDLRDINLIKTYLQKQTDPK